MVLEVKEEIVMVNQTPRSKLLLKEEDDELMVVVVELVVEVVVDREPERDV